MSFISVLFALLLEQVRPLKSGNSMHAAIRIWLRWCARNFDAGKSSHAKLALGAGVAAPTFAALLIYLLLDYFFGWGLALLWNILVLYASLGFRQFSFHFTQIRDALLEHDEALARQLIARWQSVDAQTLPSEQIVGKLVEYSVLAAHRHVFAVLAWFCLLAAFGLGPAGAVLYRLTEFVARYWRHCSLTYHLPISESLQHQATALFLAVDWLPARLTAMGFAVVGNFEEAIDAWRRYTSQADVSNDGLILAATAGALSQQIAGLGAVMQPAASPASGVDRDTRWADLTPLNSMVGLVWRTVVLWLTLLALLTLARLLG